MHSNDKLTYITTSLIYKKFIWYSTRIHFRFPFFRYFINDMPQTIHSDLFLYAGNSGLTFEHKNVYTIENQLKKCC